jgi:hypothetical protein
VRTRLPFPSVAVLSDDDPYGAAAVTRALVDDWGCGSVRLVPAGGHLNADSGLGAWPEARAWLDALPGGSSAADPSA